ncbi:MAG: pyrimidine 5'-nucleotidase [Mariprofundales bacterium]
MEPKVNSFTAKITPQPQLIVFDLDNTLYQAENGLFDQMDHNINQFMCQRLKISWQEADILRIRYWRDYGTTLTGLMRHHDVDPEPFLHAAHNFEIDRFLQQNKSLDNLLSELTARCVIHTNGTIEHAKRVLNRLGISQRFAAVYDIRFNHYQPKPCGHTLTMLLEDEACCSPDALVIDDMADNLRAAANIGCRTAWITPTIHATHAFDYCVNDIEQLLHHLIAQQAGQTDSAPAQDLAPRTDQTITFTIEEP